MNEPTGDYLDPYRDALASHGPTFEATLWRSRETQQKRFAVLTDMVDLTQAVLLDAGCGLGDLYEYLAEHKIAIEAYIGIDGLAAVIERAQKRDRVNATFLAADFVSDPTTLGQHASDIMFFSGSLNTIPETDARRVIDAAWQQARHGVVFNFLSDRCSAEVATRDTGPAHRFDTMAWIHWALEQTPYVKFRQDYFDGGHDATIGMFK